MLPATTLSLLLLSTLRADVIELSATKRAGGEPVAVFEAAPAAASGRRPGVLLLHHDLSGVDEYTRGVARRLAERGYVVFAPTLATGADFGGVADPFALSAEQGERYRGLLDRRTKAALAALKSDPRVAGDKTAVVGYCHTGGVAAMNAARAGAEVLGVATLWGGVSPKDLSTWWSRRRLKPKILVMLGGSDVETNPYLESFRQEMASGQADWRLILYGRASHGFTMPDPHPGGRGAYDADADRASWAELTGFLDGLFNAR